MAVVDSIASALLQALPVNPNLAGGDAGIALFFSALSFARPETGARFSDRALDLLGQSIDAMAARPQPPALYGGFTGVAWAVEQCRGLAADDEDPNTPIDEAVEVHLARRPWREDYDLISGLVGYGLYALERKKTSLLETVVERLSETAVVQPEGITWFTPAYLVHASQREFHPNGYYNLGLAHGVPGVIALLGQVCAAGVAVEKAPILLDGAVRWLLSKKNAHGSALYFPSVLHEDTGGEGQSSRVAWCYGDLGVSLALAWAARAVNEPAWEHEALEIARNAARLPLDRAGVRDAGLCHGSAGNAHLFNRLYQATRDPLFLDAARDWISWTLKFRQPGKGVAGFSAWRALGDEWQNFHGLLEGAAGIGLALIAASTSMEPAWDRMLMVSVPPR